MRCRLFVAEVIHIFLLLHLVLNHPSAAAPFNWSYVQELNITGNISLPDLLDGGLVGVVDYQYNLYNDFDDIPADGDGHDTDMEDMTDDIDDVTDYIDDMEDMTEEIFPPPDLGGETKGSVGRDLQREPPEYMLDLYKRFSDNKLYVHPTSNIVRSFMNVNQDVADFCCNETSTEQSGNHTRIHKLVFNITSISEEEEIDYAMLRLFTLVQQDRDAYAGVDRIVSVLQDRGKDLEPEKRYHTLSSRHIYGHNSGWEAFDVTSAVRRWAENISCVQILEVRIESVFNVVTEGDMDIDTDPKHRNEPLLVIFSNNNHERKLREKELHEMISHELDGEDGGYVVQAVVSQSAVSHKHLASPQGADLSRVKRSKKNRRNSCRRRPMYVRFQDIKWDMWIIAPAGYQAFECIGKCYFPLSDHLTPTKHAVIQTLYHNSHPKEVSRACCVPTKLDPISILYVDENEVLTYKYKYDGMQVAECGCR